MRQITDHKFPGSNEAVAITARDEPGAGGAHHLYRLEYDDPRWGPSPESMRQVLEIAFQKGPIQDGPNGVTIEALLALAIDRLRCFQAGPFACRQNALALTKIQEAMFWLHARTRDRQERAVEGKLER